MYRIIPELRHIAFLVRFTTPVSHHDPSVHDTSNVNLFLRRKQVVERTLAPIPAGVLQRLAALLPVPREWRDLFSSLTTFEFLATALLREFIIEYATAEGLGLFSGAERYRRLEERARHQAIRCSSIFAWWGSLANDLQVGIPLRGDNEVQLAALTMPPALAQGVLATLAENSTSALMLARLWAEALRENSALETLELEPFDAGQQNVVVAEIPALSANSVRHEMVREPGMWHLLNALDLDLNDLPAPVAALLYNAGDLDESAPPDAFKLTRHIRAAYPLVGLLGGATNGFVLGSSNLEVSAWLAIRENAVALERYGITPELSGLDLLDYDTLARHSNHRIDSSPMPFSFEVLAAGVEALIEFRLRPYASRLEAGALVAALDTFSTGDGTLFGQSARGYGMADMRVLEEFDDPEEQRAEYEAYLAEHRDVLRAGLLDGTLTTGKKVLS